MKKRHQPPEAPEVIRFVNGMSDKWSFSLPHLSEADVWQLHQGQIPAWMRDTIAWWCRDNPKPGELNPNYQMYQQEAAKERQSA